MRQCSPIGRWIDRETRARRLYFDPPTPSSAIVYKQRELVQLKPLDKNRRGYIPRHLEAALATKYFAPHFRHSRHPLQKIGEAVGFAPIRFPWWRWDSNPRSPCCERDALPKGTYTITSSLVAKDGDAAFASSQNGRLAILT